MKWRQKATLLPDEAVRSVIPAGVVAQLEQ
jgi:hypothetical protein